MSDSGWLSPATACLPLARTPRKSTAELASWVLLCLSLPTLTLTIICHLRAGRLHVHHRLSNPAQIRQRSSGCHCSDRTRLRGKQRRSEEHTSELQSLRHL